MLSNSDIKYIRSLHQKKFRESENKFIAEGEKVVGELIRSGWGIELICATSEWLENNTLSGSFRIEEITNSVLEKISALTTPNNILAVVRKQLFEVNYDLPEKSLSLYLNEIKDPGNLGTIIRIADWFGIRQVICSENSVDCFNPKAVQSSMGSLFHIPVIYGEAEEVIGQFRDRTVPVYAADMNGENSLTLDFPESLLLIMGSESHGIPESILQAADKKITIPGFGNAESLNVSVAAGILCALYRS